jgi:hypothetical protein
MKNNKTKEEHIANWESSGLSKTEYCREAGIHYSTFQSWIRKESPKKVEWKPISIQEEKEEPRSIFELRIGENWKLEIDLRLRF